MTLQASELVYQMKQTQAFIDANPVLITLTPRKRLKTPSGGFTWMDVPPRPTQTFRLIDISSGISATSASRGVFRSSDGIDRTAEFELLGMPDVRMDLYDAWTDLRGLKWEVSSVLPFNWYETRALVIRRGR